MTAEEQALARYFAQGWQALEELAKRNPAAADRLVAALVAHLRSARPESVAPLGTLPAPSDPSAIRDPRGSAGGR